jgi:CheY-specific phosphatase CheX
MNDLSALEFGAGLAGAVSEFFDLMLSMETDVDLAGDDDALEGKGFRTETLFEGDLEGKVSIVVGEEFARLMTASMLGIGMEEVDMASEVDDLLTEMINIVSGNLKTEFSNQGYALSFGEAEIFHDAALTGAGLKNARHQRLVFRYEDNAGLLDVSVRTPTEEGPRQSPLPENRIQKTHCRNPMKNRTGRKLQKRRIPEKKSGRQRLLHLKNPVRQRPALQMALFPRT